MTPLDIFNKNIKNSQILPTLFAIGSYLGILTLFILLENNTFPVTKQGFFCNDDSIKYPYQAETVAVGPSFLIYLTGTVSTFVIGEITSNSGSSKHNGGRTRGHGRSNFGNHMWFIRVIKLMFMCSWSSSLTSTLSSTIKTVVGRPRPNFLAVCNPNITCTPDNTQFNTDYECQGTELLGDWKRLNTDEKKMRGVNQARRSFPSGHAAHSASVATFAFLYIEKRIKTPESNMLVLLKPLMQLAWIGVALFIGMSRVKDYYHHLDDVIFGAILGMMVSFIVGRNCMKWLINSNTFSEKFESNKVVPRNVRCQTNKSV